MIIDTTQTRIERRLASPVYEFPTRQDITVLPADDPNRPLIGIPWSHYDEVGIIVIDDYSITYLEAKPEQKRKV